ncbi:hypothetical protein LRM64_24795 [Prescottella equi]|nr:hypothetical protein [Prescottella equi]MCU7531599.1 hypothetical protein [Prescottella equi]MCU7536905.1 hypothetical protein [Prescottella equi]
MIETRKPAPVQRDGQAPTNRKEKQMRRKSTPETLDGAIKRLGRLLEGRYWSMTQSETLFGGWRVKASMPLGASHPSSADGIWITEDGPYLAPLVTRVADKVEEALAMRGAA